MRPLGLLGAPLSGAPRFAGLGTGSPSASTYLRGDGTWATLSVVPFSNVQSFTASGSFTVPAGVTMVAVQVTGGGGGGAFPNGTSFGGSGGSSSFGSLIGASGGAAGWYDNGSSGAGACGHVTQIAEISPAGAIAVNGVATRSGSNYGNGGGPITGGCGGQTMAILPVTPGQVIPVTVGAAGGAGPWGATSGQQGIVIVRY